MTPVLATVLNLFVALAGRKWHHDVRSAVSNCRHSPGVGAFPPTLITMNHPVYVIRRGVEGA
jgi:hypothetical protein